MENYIIIENGNILEKYEPICDREKLKELAIKVIKRCGERKKCVYEGEYENVIKNEEVHISSYNYNNDNIKCYENVNIIRTGKTETYFDRDYYPYRAEVYECKYIKNIAPYFAGFISGLFYGDYECFLILFNRDFSSIKHFPTVEEKIKSIETELSMLKMKFMNDIKIEDLEKMDYDKLEKMKKMLLLREKESKIIEEKRKELDELIKLRELNLNQEPIDEYINELVNLVEFKLVDKIDLQEIQRINSFFENNSDQAKKYVLKRK